MGREAVPKARWTDEGVMATVEGDRRGCVSAREEERIGVVVGDERT